MKIYFFTSDVELIKDLEHLGIDGVLHTYNAYQPNAFIRIIKYLPETKIKHMVAIRPYTISPQFLSQIISTVNEVCSREIIQINLVSGWIKEDEKSAGGIVGIINDNSTQAERSNYLIDYLDILKISDNNKMDYYVSVTNNFTFDAAIKNNTKMIIDYEHFKEKKYKIKNNKTMIAINTARGDELLEHEEIFRKIEEIEDSGIDEVIFSSGSKNVVEHFIQFLKKYKAKNSDFGRV